ncbi:MAG: helix-turn-helix domain-containing protein [Pseudomonadota bacterium]
MSGTELLQDLDYIVRLVAVGSALMLLALVAAGEIRREIQVAMIGMIICVIAYLINSTPLSRPVQGIGKWIDLLSILAPFWIWLFSRRLFESEPNQRVIIGAVMVIVGGWFLGNFIPGSGQIGFYVLHAISLALIIDLVRVGLLERDDDLVEQRRIIRLWLPLLVAAQTAAILIFEIVEMVSGLEDAFIGAQLLNSMLIFVLSIFAGLALLRTDPELLIASQSARTGDPIEPTPELSPSETVLHERLTLAMSQGTYREPGLTIAALSAKLDTPEHRLRALINQRLGHRNFSAYLNKYRVEEARAKLADRALVDIPVLTIAMDLGYNSLPTFNRAFRAETGTTPSEYRRAAITSESDAKPDGVPAQLPSEPAVQN